MNVREALALGRVTLRQAAVGDASGAGWQPETPDLDAEVLLRHVLLASRAELFTYPERLLSEIEAVAYRALLERRRSGAPVAYLTGTREFMGLDFAVDEWVLIPRPETETLVERALERLEHAGSNPIVVDTGTGSGAIALSVAWHHPPARVIATDVSAGALSVARRNLEALARERPGLSVGFVRCHLLSALRGSCDLIAANLPYIPHGEMKALPPPVRDYEPHGALDGGDDGLDLYRTLLQQAPERLAPGGTLLMECDPRQAGLLLNLAIQALPGSDGAVRRDLAGLERVIEVSW